jgi:hypothetical protein
MRQKVDDLNILNPEEVTNFILDNMELAKQNAVDEIIQYTIHNKITASEMRNYFL